MQKREIFDVFSTKQVKVCLYIRFFTWAKYRHEVKNGKQS